MKSYNFEANMVARVNGYVGAESEQEAIAKIKAGDYDDIFDNTLDEPISDIVITSFDEMEE